LLHVVATMFDGQVKVMQLVGQLVDVTVTVKVQLLLSPQ
jgi:hypothetical protein